MANQEMIDRHTTLDAASLQILLSPSKDTIEELMKWGVKGFPYNYTILNMSLLSVDNGLNIPNRGNTYKYASHLLGTDLSQAVTNFGSNFQGMKFSYVTLPSSVLVLVSKVD